MSREDNPPDVVSATLQNEECCCIMIVSIVGIMCCHWQMNEYRELVELYGRKTEVLGENSVPIPLCPPQIPYGQAWDQTWTFVVCGWWYTKSWYILQNEDIVRWVQVMYFKNHCIIQTLAENFGMLVCNCCTIVWIQ